MCEEVVPLLTKPCSWCAQSIEGQMTGFDLPQFGRDDSNTDQRFPEVSWQRGAHPVKIQPNMHDGPALSPRKIERDRK